ncbi:MAG: hypothetical protein BWK76_20515 [Desulfobulbaceae bacterium A2]|nr:MAG: hypothetical protein BWK76_20515 [Desulfobulbaceae bacterium A2]
MTQLDEKLGALNQDIDRLMASKPYLQPLLDAFRPLILVRHRLLSAPWEKSTEYPLISAMKILRENEEANIRSALPCYLDPLRFSSGVPLLQQCQLFLPTDPWREIAQAVMDAIREGFPHCAQDMDALAACIAEGRMDLYDFFISSTSADGAQLSERAQDIPLAPASLALFFNVVARIVLSRRASDTARQIAPLSWSKGYCPVCGSFPMLSISRDKGQRWLQCAQCSHEWQYPWGKCPWCEHESPEEKEYFFVEGEAEEKGFSCEHCQKYLLSLRRPTGLLDEDNDIAAISLAHLDLILQKKGYRPMADCAWNVF